MSKYYADEDNAWKQKDTIQGRMQTYYADEDNAQKQKDTM